MAILRPNVQAPLLSVFKAGLDLSLRGTAAGQFVRDNRSWEDPLILEELAQQALCRLCSSPALNHDTDHNPVLDQLPGSRRGKRRSIFGVIRRNLLCKFETQAPLPFGDKIQLKSH